MKIEILPPISLAPDRNFVVRMTESAGVIYSIIVILSGIPNFRDEAKNLI